MIVPPANQPEDACTLDQLRALTVKISEKDAEARVLRDRRDELVRRLALTGEHTLTAIAESAQVRHSYISRLLPDRPQRRPRKRRQRDQRKKARS